MHTDFDRDDPTPLSLLTAFCELMLAKGRADEDEAYELGGTLLGTLDPALIGEALQRGWQLDDVPPPSQPRPAPSLLERLSPLVSRLYATAKTLEQIETELVREQRARKGPGRTRDAQSEPGASPQVSPVSGSGLNEGEIRAQSLALWTAYVARHADQLEALRNSAAPVELPLGTTRWVALDPTHQVLGAGTTIEEAHRAAVNAEIVYLTPEYLSRFTEGPDEEDERQLPYGTIASYVLLQGPEAAVLELARKGGVV